MVLTLMVLMVLVTALGLVFFDLQLQMGHAYVGQHHGLTALAAASTS